MEKTALKNLVEEAVSEAINEIQITAFPKLNGQQRALGNSGIYNRAKREVHRITNGLPATVTSESEIQELCRFLDNFNYESLNDPRFRGSVKAIVMGARKKFSSALRTLKEAEAKQKQLSQRRPESVPASIREPEPTEETFPVTPELYAGYIGYRIIDCFPNLQKFFAFIGSKTNCSDMDLKEEDIKNTTEGAKKELTAMNEEIVKIIVEKNPYTEGVEEITIPWPEITAVMKRKAESLRELLHLEISEEQIDEAFKIFEPRMIANRSVKIPQRLNKKQKNDIEDTEFQAFAIEHSAESAITEAIKKARRSKLQPKEKEDFLMLVVDHINEKIQEADSEKILSYFKTYSGEEFLVDVASLFNDSFHGGIEVRDQGNLFEMIEKYIVPIQQKCGEKRRQATPITASVSRKEEEAAPAEDPKENDEITSKIAYYIEWAKEFQKPGSQFLFKLFAAAGVTLETYGSILSEQQKLIVITLFDNLREIVEEREEVNKRRAVRIEKLVEAILEALKPISPKPETKARTALEKLEKRLAEVEEEIERLVMETDGLGSLQRELGEIEAQNHNTEAHLKTAQDETENAKKELDTAIGTLSQASPGSDEFTRALSDLNEKNIRYLGCKSALDGIRTKSETEEAKWVQLSRQIEAVQGKKTELRELESLYETMIKDISKI